MQIINPFKEILQKDICFYFEFNKEQNINEPHTVSLLGDRILLAISKLVDIIIQIYKDEEDDYRKCKHLNKIEINGTIYYEPKEEFVNRFCYRFYSYIVIICTLEELLEKAFSDFNKRIQKYELIHLLKGINKLNFKHKDLQKDIELFRNWRNKVVCHSSFAKPKDDDIFIQFTSLLYTGAQIIIYGSKGFMIGGVSLSSSYNSKTNSIKENFFREPIGILSTFNNIIEHYKKWAQLFDARLSKIREYFLDENSKLEYIIKMNQKNKKVKIHDIRFRT